MAADPTALYKQISLENAPPIKIVRLLYEKAIQHMERLRRLDPVQQPIDFNAAIEKADAIVVELRISLDPSHAPHLTTNLESLYLFVEDRLALALAERSAEPIVAAIGVMRDLLEAWRSIELGGGIDATGRTAA